MSTDDEDGLDFAFFQDPEGFYQPDKPATYAEHTLNSGRVISLRLVGNNPLWGHLLWNAGRTVASFLEDRAHELVKNKTVLELGAGSGLPSIVCAMNGARQVVVTDYPDPDLITNLRHNIEHCGLPGDEKKIAAEGYLWGAPVHGLTEYLTAPDDTFDLVILADLLFNHSEHSKLVSTLVSTMKRDGLAQALVFFTPYRPWLYEKDMAFFDIARERGFKVTKILEHVMAKVMFEEDRGDELLRRTVFAYRLERTEVGLDNHQLDL